MSSLSMHRLRNTQTVRRISPWTEPGDSCPRAPSSTEASGNRALSLQLRRGPPLLHLALTPLAWFSDGSALPHALGDLQQRAGRYIAGLGTTGRACAALHAGDVVRVPDAPEESLRFPRAKREFFARGSAPRATCNFEGLGSVIDNAIAERTAIGCPGHRRRPEIFRRICVRPR